MPQLSANARWGEPEAGTLCRPPRPQVLGRITSIARGYLCPCCILGLPPSKLHAFKSSSQGLFLAEGDREVSDLAQGRAGGRVDPDLTLSFMTPQSL